MPTLIKDLAVSSTGRGNSQFDSSSFTDRIKGGTLEYANFMFTLYDKVVAAAGLPNFMGAHILFPTNLNFKAWHEIAVTSDELRVVAFLTFGIPAGYEGPIPSPSIDNHASANAHPRDIAHYITTEIGHGAMLEPFDHPPFTSWCQINHLLTHP